MCRFWYEIKVSLFCLEILSEWLNGWVWAKTDLAQTNFSPSHSKFGPNFDIICKENFSHPLSETMHGLQDGASMVSILRKPLLFDGVGTAVLRRAEEPLENTIRKKLEDPRPPLLVYRHRISAIVLRTSKDREPRYACPVRILHFFFWRFAGCDETMNEFRDRAR